MKRNFVDFLYCNKKSIGTAPAASMGFLCFAAAGCRCQEAGCRPAGEVSGTLVLSRNLSNY